MLHEYIASENSSVGVSKLPLRLENAATVFFFFSFILWRPMRFFLLTAMRGAFFFSVRVQQTAVQRARATTSPLPPPETKTLPFSDRPWSAVDHRVIIPQPHAVLRGLCRTCIYSTGPAQEACAIVDHADSTGPTRQHELDHTDHLSYLSSDLSPLKDLDAL